MLTLCLKLVAKCCNVEMTLLADSSSASGTLLPNTSYITSTASHTAHKLWLDSTHFFNALANNYTHTHISILSMTCRLHWIGPYQ